MQQEINPLTGTPYPPMDHMMNEDGAVDIQKLSDEKPKDMSKKSLLYWVEWPLPDDPDFNLEVKTEILKRTDLTLPDLTSWEEIKFKFSKDFRFDRWQQGNKALRKAVESMSHD